MPWPGSATFSIVIGSPLGSLQTRFTVAAPPGATRLVTGWQTGAWFAGACTVMFTMPVPDSSSPSEARNVNESGPV